MAYLPIKTYPDPILRKTCEPIEAITGETVMLCDNMIETMRLAQGGTCCESGGGFGASFCNRPPSKKGEQAIILINPVIAEQDGEEINEEGCLSFPKFYEYIKRAKKVLVKGVDLQGEPFEMECEGF